MQPNPSILVGSRDSSRTKQIKGLSTGQTTRYPNKTPRASNEFSSVLLSLPRWLLRIVNYPLAIGRVISYTDADLSAFLPSPYTGEHHESPPMAATVRPRRPRPRCHSPPPNRGGRRYQQT